MSPTPDWHGRLRRGGTLAGAHRTAGTLHRAGRAGSNRVAFSGRVGGKALRRGAYRLVVSATDAAGNRSTARTATFRIVR